MCWIPLKKRMTMVVDHGSIEVKEEGESLVAYYRNDLFVGSPFKLVSLSKEFTVDEILKNQDVRRKVKEITGDDYIVEFV